MIFYVQNPDGSSADGEQVCGIDMAPSAFAKQIGDCVLKKEGIDIECYVNLMLADDKIIRSYNRDYRGIDKATDVLSFPNLDFDTPGVISIPKEMEADYIDPDNNMIYLGDMIISLERVKAQAGEYGHSPKRELGFLIAHSMLHLCGYDHMTAEDEQVMIQKQDAVLNELEIVRE